MRRLAHISDLHFGRADMAVADALVDELNRMAPDLIVASGDFTQGARSREFRQAAAFLKRLAAPVLAVVGNHDITPYHLLERFLDPYARFRRYIQPGIEPVWQDDELIVIGINTARRMAPELNWSYGRISQRQMNGVERILAAAPASLYRIVVGHHPFLPPAWDEDARVVMRAKRAIAVFERAGVGLILSGHLHRGYSRFAKPEVVGEEVARVTESSGATTSRRLMVVQAGSAISTRLRGEPNAFNVITIADGRATVEPRRWNGAAWSPSAIGAR
jgi:3',5'-cyclic AMP phosphodiesterase CpdA